AGAMAPLGYDVLLELIDSSITYRQRYSIQASRVTVIDLAILDPGNPRSVAFQVERIVEHAAALAGRACRDMPAGLEGRARRLQSRLALARAITVDEDFLVETATDIHEMATWVGDSFFSDDDPEVEDDEEDEA